MMMCITSFVPERRERWCYYVPALYTMRRVWRVKTRKQVKRERITF